MNNDVARKSGLLLFLSLPVLLSLSGCSPLEWIKRKLGADKKAAASTSIAASTGSGRIVDDGSPVLVRINGEAVITLDSFQKEFDSFVDKNRLRQLIQFMPDARDKFLDGLISQYVIEKYIADKGIDQKEEFKNEMEQIHKSARQMLSTKYFADLYPAQVSESDMKAFYEENKDKLPDILIARGGVNAVGIDFVKSSDAQLFFDRVKSNANDFAKIAQEMKIDGKIKSFDLVTEQSPGIDPMLRDKIVLYEKFPTVEMIKISDNSCWVVYAKEKKKTECRPYEQVKATIEQYVMREKRMEVLEKEIERLKKQYKVTVDKSSFTQENAPLEGLATEDVDINDQEAAQAQAL